MSDPAVGRRNRLFGFFSIFRDSLSLSRQVTFEPVHTDLYEPLIFGIGRRHGLQPADANDLVQEVLAAVANSIDRFEPNQNRGRFRSWLFRVARNHALMKLRRLNGPSLIQQESDWITVCFLSLIGLFNNSHSQQATPAFDDGAASDP